jgi:hypothetical protein
LKFLDTGGFINIDLFVSNCAGDSICVYTGAYKSFNSWTLVKDNRWRAVIVNGIRLAVVDSTGKEVPPNIPLLTRNDLKIRKSIAPGQSSSISGNLMINIKGQAVHNPAASSVLINKKHSLVIIYDNAHLDWWGHTPY